MAQALAIARDGAASYIFGMSEGKPSPSEGKPGFTVTDRRSVSSEADPTAGEAAAASPSAAEGSLPGAAGSTMPPVDFATFVLSLGSSALLHLGELDEPTSGAKPKVDLGLAKHTIDVLAMLQEKPKGNLSSAEGSLLENLLFDLRLRFVETSGGSSARRG